MERNFAEEIDALREQMNQVLALLQPKKQPPYVGHVQSMPGMHPDPAIDQLMANLTEACGSSASAGQITYLGVVASGGRQSNWIRANMSVDSLLSLGENGSLVEKVLACIGNADRMKLLISLLRKPQTVAQMVEEGGYSSTGQVYNLLKPLITATLVEENASRRGQYVIVPDRVQGIVMLLAGINDLLGPTYHEGQW